MVGTQNTGRPRRQRTPTMGPLDAGVVAVGVDQEYPQIPFLPGERSREIDLQKIGRGFQAELDERKIPCALKGGTALRLRLGLPRPSTDLDFEGNKRVHVRKTAIRALARSGMRQEYRIGINWFKIGTVRLSPRGTRQGTTARGQIDGKDGDRRIRTKGDRAGAAGLHRRTGSATPFLEEPSRPRRRSPRRGHGGARRRHRRPGASRESLLRRGVPRIPRAIGRGSHQSPGARAPDRTPRPVNERGPR